MLKYAKLINKETGLVEVGTGTNSDFYKSIGMTEQNVDIDFLDGFWYLSEFAAKKGEMKVWKDVEIEIEVEVEPAVYETIVVPAVTETIRVEIFDDEGKPVLDDEGNPTYQEETIVVMPEREEQQLVKEAVYGTQTITVQRFVPVINPNYEEEQAEKERERLDKLNVTRGDMFEALLLSRQITKSQIREMILQYVSDPIQLALMLNRFDEALNYYRGYPIFNLLGVYIGITSEQWDSYFDKATKEETKADAWKELLPVILNESKESQEPGNEVDET